MNDPIKQISDYIIREIQNGEIGYVVRAIINGGFYNLKKDVESRVSREEMADYTINNKGIFATVAALETQLPKENNKKDWFAFVGKTNPREKYIVKADGGAWTPTGEMHNVADIDMELLKLLFVNQDGNHLLTVLDKENNIIALWDRTGKLHTRFADSSIEYKSLSVDLRKILNYASELSDNIFLENNAYLALYLDQDGNILEYYDKKGVRHIEKAKIENLDNPTLNIIKTAVHIINSGYIYAELDSKGNIIEATRKDGTKYIEKLSVGSLKGYESGATSKSKINDMTSAHIPRPTKNCAPTINIIGTLPTDNSTTIVKMEFNGFDVLPFTKYAKTSIQGRSSRVHPKKNLSIDLYNDAACTSEFDLKIGKWVCQNSNHMKANYINITQANNVASANIANEAYNLIPKPWFRTSDFENSNFYDDFDLSPRCVIDGFAVRVLNNGVFHGYYTYNLKKHRANYHMKKDDKKAILLDCANQYTFSNQFDHKNWELRNPKLKGYVENGVIEDAGVLADINRFWDWAKSTKGSTIRNDANEYIDVDNTLIHILLIDFLCAYDCVQMNSLIEIRNNITSHWIYDLDNTFGFYGWDVGTYKFLPTDYEINFDANGFFGKVIIGYNDELKAMYAKLRSSGIFTVDNVNAKFRDIMDSIGYDGYVEELERWPKIPSYTEVKDSLPRILDWSAKRLTYLDNKYSYNN